MSGTTDAGELSICDVLSGLSTAAVGWVGRNLPFFDPFSPVSPLPAARKVKAVLELAVFCHRWAKLRPTSDLFHRAGALLQGIWRRPEFPVLLDTHGGPYTDSQRLVYLALAPDDHRDAALAPLSDGYLSPAGKSPYLRLETRYYADKANLAHGMESYRELAAGSLLARPPTPPVSTRDAYTMTHTAFYLSDYGHLPVDLPDDARERALRAVAAMVVASAGEDLWDLTGELLITLACLGGDVTGTPAGQVGIRCLAGAQLPGGAIPGRSAASGVPPDLPPGQFFRRAYHTTLVAALVGMVAGTV